MPLAALVFDVDGTLADTERDGHLPACNEAFATLGYPVQWTWDEFVALQPVQGNALRMRMALERVEPPIPPDEIQTAAARLKLLKRELYIDKYLPRLPLRPGIAATVDAALSRGLRLAIVSTSDEAQIHALLRQKLPHAAEHFRPVLGKESGMKTAPESPLYRRCLDLLGTKGGETLAIEDSALGARAAVSAGLRCAVFYNHYTFGADFSGARLVACSLEPFSLDLLEALCLA